MSGFSVQSLYFDRPGPRNTAAVLEKAAQRARELEIKRVVLATSTGRTAQEALKFFDPQEFEIIAVTHVTGFTGPNLQEMTPEVRADLEAKGVKLITAAHAFGGVGRAVRNKLQTYQVDEIMAYTLRMFGHGSKVAVEISLMAADAGLVRSDEDVVAIGGTGKGADTALVIQPASTHLALDLKVREVIAKPWRP